MNIDSLFTELYHKKPLLTKTNLGLTNDIYTFEVDGQKYALRIPIDDINDLLPRSEKEVLCKVRRLDLDFEEVYYDQHSRIRITKWVDDLVEFKDFKDPSRYLRTVQMIKKLHSLNERVTEDFKLDLIYHTYLDHIKNPLFDYAKHDKIITDFLQLEDSYELSHNDLVSGNILFAKDRSYLIDYEYGANNHPYFDLMSFISENEIDDPQIRTLIFKAYFGDSLNVNIMRKLEIIEKCQNLLWASWANMLYDSRGADVYLEIFKSKIQHLNMRNETYFYY